MASSLIGSKVGESQGVRKAAEFKRSTFSSPPSPVTQSNVLPPCPQAVQPFDIASHNKSPSGHFNVTANIANIERSNVPSLIPLPSPASNVFPNNLSAKYEIKSQVQSQIVTPTYSTTIPSQNQTNMYQYQPQFPPCSYVSQEHQSPPLQYSRQQAQINYSGYYHPAYMDSPSSWDTPQNITAVSHIYLF
ncbi:unnamed protein product [Protopolystoma xenopodis]|uniref:Uncharacterized protein n=1 Tax=Protopolystoma xenopodis TaxID=117903 RepID=A0A448WMY7_9PLAT|nr:unnamed protein product [Protopolystoma xenopodis]